MKFFRFLITTAYLSLFIFMSVSIVMGDTGYRAYQELETYKEQLAANVKELETINQGLKLQCQTLGSQEEMLLQARSIGLVSKQERVIIIDNQTGSICSYDLGGRYSSNIKDQNRIINIRNLRVFSFAIAFFLALLIYSFSGLRNGSKKRRSQSAENTIPEIAE